MGEIIERVATAIADRTILVSKITADDGYQRIHVLKSDAEAVALAALAAMREPTEAMLKAVPVPWGGQGVHVPEPTSAEVWRAMIDAAISEPGSPVVPSS